MIIVKSPVRLGLGGGGTDLPEYSQEHKGLWISGAIDKFIYVGVKKRFESQIRLSYSKLELVDSIDQIEHPIIRETLNHFEIKNHIEITSIGDIPAGTGLGSSGAFTVSLLHALGIYTRKPVKNLAETAYHIEREILGRPIGKQDQYASLKGGLRVYTMSKRGEIRDMEIVAPRLSEYLALFYTNIKRDSGPVLSDVVKKTELLHEIKRIGEKSIAALRSKDYTRFCELLDEHWTVKREMSNKMTNPQIDKWYEKAKSVGVLGGKLAGAGGGGFFLFGVPDLMVRKKLYSTMVDEGLVPLPFRFHRGGTEMIEI